MTRIKQPGGRHGFFNTHPLRLRRRYWALVEEKRANGARLTMVLSTVSKVGLMGPLAGVGDPIFWVHPSDIRGAGRRYCNERQPAWSAAVFFGLFNFGASGDPRYYGVWLHKGVVYR